jgi:ElaB/YqjD/DUF883 family membrane-anchored ribosome-binding protein
MKDKNNKENAKKRDHEKEMEEFKKRIFEDLNEQTRRIRDLEAREAAGEKIEYVDDDPWDEIVELDPDPVK